MINQILYKYSDIPYLVKYEKTYPKPKSLIPWGQLKMFLVTLFFLMKKIELSDKEVHIIYAGSATGDNILLLCQLFPNTRWYLIDPRKHNKELYKKMENKDQIYEIIEGYFIREGTEDDKVLANQESNANWHKIIQPDYSYFKFRCGYESETNYNYYEGIIYVQFYAPQSSTETRILFEKELKPCVYNINEYQGKLLYFNRIIRPSYHKSLIKDNNLFDHCYDCVYFGYIIKNYIEKFVDFNPFKTNENKKETDILNIMTNITDYISKYSRNKIKMHNKYIRNNIK